MTTGTLQIPTERVASVVIETPLGRLGVEASGSGVRRVRFDASEAATSADHGAASDQASRVLRDAVEQLRAYFETARSGFDAPLDLDGSAFQLAAWEAMRRIPPGQTIGYGELARRLGSPSAARAVGLACARNPIPIIIPCHRVVQADGGLRGFGGGLWRKRWLLQHEAAGNGRETELFNA